MVVEGHTVRVDWSTVGDDTMIVTRGDQDHFLFLVVLRRRLLRSLAPRRPWPYGTTTTPRPNGFAPPPASPRPGRTRVLPGWERIGPRTPAPAASPSRERSTWPRAAGVRRARRVPVRRRTRYRRAGSVARRDAMRKALRTPASQEVTASRSRTWFTRTRTTRTSPAAFSIACSPTITPRSGRCRWNKPTRRSATPSCRGAGRTSGWFAGRRTGSFSGRRSP
ncbi:hypothetical protein ACH47C_13360 [Streptomyces rishiriensis]|uniref:hypothetical protein n=1 Tax=Streptomyces rishiriensis TaxID=68264 RepID=UPI003791FB2F